MQNNKRPFWRMHRFYVLLIIIVGVIIFWTEWLFPGLQAKLPHILLPAEPLFQISGDFYLTNTMVATFLADILLILLAIGVYRAASSGDLIPKGFSGAVEALLEVIHNLTESTAGKWTKTIFPFFATITLLVLVVNWMELIPSVDSIGKYDSHHLPHAEEVTAGEAGHDEAGSEEHVSEAPCDFRTFLGMKFLMSGDDECSAAVVPFVRVASTDLNFTVALAVISVVGTQVIGFMALRMSYFRKFWNTSTIFSSPLGVIDFGVGILEIVSEVSKILSFSFRLFGNIFAGSVLLFVIGSLVPVFAQSVFLLLEFFVGLIQAVVFGMLTMVFWSQATEAHGHGDEH